MDHKVNIELTPPVARLTLSNPPLNVIDIQMMDELAAALAQTETSPNISALTIRGAGKCFSAGVDVAAHAPDLVPVMLQKFHAVIRALVASRKVSIAIVHGSCLGGGAELAMGCDLVYTSADARWGFPEIELGCFPPVAATALSSLIGQKRASELILTGRIISGVEACEIGLATRQLPEEHLAGLERATLDKLAQLSPAVLAIAKKAVYAWDAMHFDKGLARAEKIYLDELMKTADVEEGIRAFLGKRSPQWKHR